MVEYGLGKKDETERNARRNRVDRGSNGSTGEVETECATGPLVCLCL